MLKLAVVAGLTTRFRVMAVVIDEAMLDINVMYGGNAKGGRQRYIRGRCTQKTGRRVCMNSSCDSTGGSYETKAIKCDTVSGWGVRPWEGRGKQMKREQSMTRGLKVALR